jgi:DNA-binding XRE family transcriptional regulator
VKTSTPTHKRAVTNRLWRYRKERQLFQKDVARLLGHKTLSLVSEWENGRKTPTLDSALMLAHILKAPVEALFADRALELRSKIDKRAAKTPELHARLDHTDDQRTSKPS